MDRKRPLSEKVIKDHNQVKQMYKDLMASHKLAYSFSRSAIYAELAEQTGYSEKQIQRILNE
jgi:hypothetical protein